MKALPKFAMLSTLLFSLILSPLKAVTHYWWCDGQDDYAINESLPSYELYAYLNCGEVRLIEKQNYMPRPEDLLSLQNEEWLIE